MGADGLDGGTETSGVNGSQDPGSVTWPRPGGGVSRGCRVRPPCPPWGLLWPLDAGELGCQQASPTSRGKVFGNACRIKTASRRVI